MDAKEKKAQIIAELKDKFENSSSAVLIDYRGITVAEATVMREECRKTGVVYKIYKNTLTERAVKELGYTDLIPYLKGPTAIAFGVDDPVAPAKVLTQFAKDNEKLEIKAGVMGGKLMDMDAITALSKLPSREELLAQVLSAMNAVPTGFVRALADVPRRMVNVLNAIKDQKEAA